MIRSLTLDKPYDKEPELVDKPCDNWPDLVDKRCEKEPDLVDKPCGNEPDLVDKPCDKEHDLVDKPSDNEPDLVDKPCDKEPNLHEHEVGGGVEVGQAVKGEVVVEAVEGGGDEVEDHHPQALPHGPHQRAHAVSEYT